MELPEGIEKEILEYLHLEWGQSPYSPNSIKLKDLEYEGVYDVAGVLTHYWKYGTSNNRRWATVEPFGDSYAISMTSNTPKPVSKSDLYMSIEIDSDDYGGYRETIELERWSKGCFGLDDYTDLQLPDGEVIKILVETSTDRSPPSTTIGIREEGKEVYVRGSVGLAMSYKTIGGKRIFLTVGTGPWE